MEDVIRQRVEIDEMQCRFMLGFGTTDAMQFIVPQLHEMHMAANKPLYMIFVDLEKAFDRSSVQTRGWCFCSIPCTRL